MKKSLLLIGIMLFSISASSQYYSDPENQWDFCPNNDCNGWTIIEDSVFSCRIILEDSTDSVPPTIYRFCRFEQGIRMSGMDDVYFYGCTFLNNNVQLGASDEVSKTQSWQSCNNVTIDSCQFLNSEKDSFVTIRNKDIPETFDHDSLKIINSYFENWGKSYPGNKLYHAVYIKSTDAIVENCTMKNIEGGSAITMRNSGIVRGNRISRKTHGMSSITYWNQFPGNTKSKKLIIENNEVFEPAYHQQIHNLSNSANGSTNGNIKIGSLTSNGYDQIVDSIIIQFNTIVVLDSLPDSLSETAQTYSGIRIESIFSDTQAASKNVMVYGNVIIDLRNESASGVSNYIKDAGGSGVSNDFVSENAYDTTLNDFESATYPFDFHLKCSNSARIHTLSNYTAFPSDKDDKSRPDPNGELDFGAYQYVSSSPYSGYYKILNRNSGNAIKIDGVANYDSIVQYEWENWTGQYWSFIELCNGRYAIHNKKSGNFIRTDGINDNSPIDQHDWNNWTGQYWLVEDLQNGYYKLESVRSGKVLKIDGIDNNDPIVQYDWQNWTGQHWTIESINGSSSRIGSTNIVTGLGSEDLSKTNEIFYPNPSNGLVKIEFQSKIRIQDNIIIFDLSGRELKRIDVLIKEGFNLLEVNLNNLEAGTYFISIDGLKLSSYLVKK